MTTVISIENLSKSYRLGQIGTGTFAYDLNVWWARVRGKPNPLARIGEKDHGNRAGEEVWALKDISFKVNQGEVLGIIGRNGAGKSTLLKILSRVTAPTSGEIKVKGRVASLLEVGTGFHPDLTGRENVYLNGAILGMNRREIDRKFDEIVDFSEVEKFIDTPVKRYSSGMYVRLAFAVAANLDPEILVVDEVLAVGDAEFQKKCLGKMDEVAHQGKTVLFVSHNMSAIKTLCTRALLVSKGQIASTGPVDDVVNAYMLANFDQPTDQNPLQVRDGHRSQGSRDVRLERVGMQAMDGTWKREFAVWEPFKVVLEIENHQAIQREVGCWFAIAAPDGNYVGTSIQYDDPAQENRMLPGRARVTLTADCRDNLLKPGTYFLSAGVIGKYREVLDWCDRLISFEVSHQVHERDHLYDGRVGMFALRSEWKSAAGEENRS